MTAFTFLPSINSGAMLATQKSQKRMENLDYRRELKQELKIIENKNNKLINFMKNNKLIKRNGKFVYKVNKGIFTYHFTKKHIKSKISLNNKLIRSINLKLKRINIKLSRK